MSERPPLKPVYLISGSDRPKVDTALQRLRARFVPEAIDIVSAVDTPVAEVVTLCNSGSLLGDQRLVVVTDVDGTKKDENRPPTGGWKAADLEGITDYLASPAPGTVLALVALQLKKEAPLAKACARTGDVLLYDVAKSGRIAWVAERFRQAGVNADADACALLIQYIGEEDLHGLGNEIAKIATWAQGEPVGVAEVELLSSAMAEIPPFALTDAWAERHPGRLLEVAEAMLDRSDKSPRDTAPRLAASMNAHLGRLRQLKRLAAEGQSARDAAATLKMHPFYGQKLYRQAENFSDAELGRAAVAFARLDLALKGGSRLPPELELQQALVDVSREPGE